MSVDEILNIATPEDFERAAMAVFRHQATECEPYREYIDAARIDPRGVTRVEEIPFLPIEFFKTRRVYCGAGEPEAVFTSSSTGGDIPARHYVAHLADYERIYTRGFEIFYGLPSRYAVFALLPSYLEREGSSLVRMAAGLIEKGRESGLGGGFYLRNHDQLMADMSAGGRSGKILLGVSYALLDLAEELSASGRVLPPRTIVMETGGMKGRRTEMSKAQMHSVLQRAFGVPEIHSEYGMAELMSQAYSVGGGIFRTPPWMRVAVRDLVDPFDVRWAGEGRGGDGAVRGALNIIDLGNLHSCAFVATQDMGRIAPDGSFTLAGRVARSDVRGCNLLISYAEE
jgi:hypothetical protein